MATLPDKLLINLKILSKIQKNGKICKSINGIISLEYENFYQCFSRFLHNDSRKQSVYEINSIIIECNNKLKEIYNNKFMNKENSSTEEYIQNCEIILLLANALKYAKEGIENLKFTYTGDYNTVSQLDIIILKINGLLKESLYKINFFNSYLTVKKRFVINDELQQYNAVSESMIQMSTFDHFSTNYSEEV